MIERYSQDGTSKAFIEVDEFGVYKFRRLIHVDDETIAQCRAEYEASKTRPAGECFDRGRLFAIPTDLFFDWLSEGFDPADHSAIEIAAKLRREGLDYLICNAKL